MTPAGLVVCCVLLVAASAQPDAAPPLNEKPTANEQQAPEPTPPAASATQPDRWDRLRALAENERPQPPVNSVAPPRGLATEALAPITKDDAVFTDATESLADVATRLTNTTPADTLGAEPSPADAERVAEWRELAADRLAERQTQSAISLLERAVELDPDNNELWVELGEARLLQRDGAGAVRAFAQAAQRGSRDPRAMLMLGRAEAVRGRPDEAAGLFLRALEDPGELSPDDRAPLYAGLADALATAGRLAAAVEADLAALAAVGESLERAAEDGTPISADVLDLARRRSEIWSRVGDASLRLGQAEVAVDAYSRALRFPTLNAAALERRRVFASLQLGRPARAALHTLTAIRRDGGRVDRSRVELLTRFAQDPELAEAATEALAAIEQELKGGADFPLPPAAASGLVRARAALASDAEAERALLDHLAMAPEDADAARDLLARAPTPERAADLFVRLINRAPFNADQYADRLVASSLDARRIRSLLDATPEGAVASAALSLALDDPRAAAERLRTADLAVLGPGAKAMAARVAALSGDWDRLEEVLRTLDADANNEARRARAEALRAAQRFPEALDTLAPLLDQAAPTPELIPALIDGAELALGAGDPERAQVWLEQALIADPADPRAHRAIVRLYLPDGPLPDAQRLSEVIRDIRRADPSGALLRFLAARELAEAGQLARAERGLQELIQSGYDDPAALDILVETWTRLTAADADTYARAERWLRARLADSADDTAQTTAYTVALARILTQDNRGAEADELLDAALQRSFDRTLSQLRESLLREVLGRPLDADRLALARLESGPRGLDDAFELATLHAARGRWSEAVAELDRALPPSVALTRSQAETGQRLLAALLRTALNTEDEDNPITADARAESRAAADDLLELLLDRGQSLTAETLAQHVGVMALRPERTVGDVVDAAERAADADPDNATLRRVQASELLREAGRINDATVVARRLARAHPDDDDLLFQVFRLVVLAADADPIAQLLEADLSEGEARRLAARLSMAGRDAEDIAVIRTELLHRAAIELHGLANDPASRALYRRVLTRDPTHGMAANNLGYALLEDGELDEAEPLLETAAQFEPESANVLDSIGWLRYRQGRLRDAIGPDGEVIRGAKSWLLLAVATPLGAENEVLLDHLGDTHYRLGERDQARLRWTEADRIAREQLRLARQRSLIPQIEQLDQLRTNIADKLAALDTGEPAPVAAIQNEPAPAAPEQPQ
ncbi:MAG: tetratricopeptide repeat protein [Planctomycetota bacterium]